MVQLPTTVIYEGNTLEGSVSCIHAEGTARTVQSEEVDHIRRDP